MIRFIVGTYELQKDDILVREINSSTLKKNFITKFRNLVLFTNELSLKKKDLDSFIDLGLDLTIVVHDKQLIKGKRKGAKKYSIEYTDEESRTKVETNPFELIKYVFKCEDRKMLFSYLKDSKASLFMLIKIMSCNAHRLSKSNREVVEWLCKNYFKVKYDLVCAMIAFKIKYEQIWQFDWLYPKKETEKDE